MASENHSHHLCSYPTSGRLHPISSGYLSFVYSGNSDFCRFVVMFLSRLVFRFQKRHRHGQWQMGKAMI